MFVHFVFMLNRKVNATKNHWQKNDKLLNNYWRPKKTVSLKLVKSGIWIIHPNFRVYFSKALLNFHTSFLCLLSSHKSKIYRIFFHSAKCQTVFLVCKSRHLTASRIIMGKLRLLRNLNKLTLSIYLCDYITLILVYFTISLSSRN